ncbi:MAG: hypothetical protein ACUVTZ_03355 [Armatimonadota bacterium]
MCGNVRCVLSQIRIDIEQLPGFPQLSEADTCDKVILRMLREAGGYSYADYMAHERDAAGQMPDYCFLPSEPQKAWFLEAKAYKIDLQDSHAVQAINYANQNGGRWVVLTNGREWRLYDNDIKGVTSEKLVASADVDDLAGLAEFIVGVGKKSAESDGIKEYALNCRVKRLLDAQLKDPNSSVVQGIVERLRGLGLTDVTGEHVVRYFKGGVGPGPATRTLSWFVKHPSEVTSRKPRRLEVDSRPVEVDTWSRVLIEFLDWLCERGKLPPAPFPPNTGALYNATPTRVNGKPMGHPRFLSSIGYHLELKWSAESILKWMLRLCEDRGISADSIGIELR